MKNQAKVIETMQISAREKAILLEELEDTRHRDGAEQERGNLRVSMNTTDAILSLTTKDGTIKRFGVIPRNLSRDGIAVIHGRFVYPATQCEIVLPTISGDLQPRKGSVTHCRHLQGLLHEIGLKFDAPVDLRDFVQLTPAQETRFLKELGESMPDQAGAAKATKERALIVDDFASDRRLISHWLGKSGIESETLAECDIEKTKAMLAEHRIDLLIIDMHLGAQSGTDLIRAVREAACDAPILAISADDDEQTTQSAITAGACDFIRKPFSKDDLLFAVGRLLGHAPAAESDPIRSTLAEDEDMSTLLTEFAEGLPQQIAQLRGANAQSQYDVLERLAYALKSVGSGYGFEPISKHAGDVMSALNEEHADMNKIKEKVDRLVSLLTRVKV